MSSQATPVALLTFLLIALTGCDRTESDPAQRFKSLAAQFTERLRADFKTQTVISATEFVLSEDYEYDLQKTNSLVSPYRGFIKVGWTAKYSNGNITIGTYSFVITYKEKHWVLEEAFNTVKEKKYTDPQHQKLFGSLDIGVPNNMLKDGGRVKGTILEVILSSWEKVQK